MVKKSTETSSQIVYGHCHSKHMLPSPWDKKCFITTIPAHTPLGILTDEHVDGKHVLTSHKNLLQQECVTQVISCDLPWFFHNLSPVT